jgi:hypothetical protein
VLRPVVFVSAALVGLTGLVLACGSEDESPSSFGVGEAGSPEAGRAETGGGGGDAGEDAAPLSVCALTRAYVEGCKEDLNCGSAKFDEWCKLNDEAINSDAFRRAEAKCLVGTPCDGNLRRDCEYKHYGTETPTPAQSQLVSAYCKTCEPADTAACAKRETTYDPSAGPKGVSDVFVAAWELNDALTDAIRAKCTGAALAIPPDGGDGGCAKAFGSCAAEEYLNKVPDCP